MYELFTPLINRLILIQVLVCPGHTRENQCAGGALTLAQPPHNLAGTAWFSTRRLSFPAWTLFCHCLLYTLQHQAPEATRGRIHRKGGARVLSPHSPFSAKLFPEVLTSF